MMLSLFRPIVKTMSRLVGRRVLSIFKRILVIRKERERERERKRKRK
jgi:hypothetical protein